MFICEVVIVKAIRHERRYSLLTCLSIYSLQKIQLSRPFLKNKNGSNLARKNEILQQHSLHLK